MGVDSHDGLNLRCRLLGHDVPFSYCRQVAEGLPCRLVLDCWHEAFEVTEFIEEHYTAEQRQKFLAPPKPKVASLVELIEKARQRDQQAG